jgi:hypothetical protein
LSREERFLSTNHFGIAPAGFYTLSRSKEKLGIGQPQIDRGKLFSYPWFVLRVTLLHQSFKENLPFQEFSIS